VNKLVALRNLYGLQYYTARRGRVTGAALCLAVSVLNAITCRSLHFELATPPDYRPSTIHHASSSCFDAVNLYTFTRVRYKAVVDLPGIVIVEVNIPSLDLVQFWRSSASPADLLKVSQRAHTHLVTGSGLNVQRSPVHRVAKRPTDVLGADHPTPRHSLLTPTCRYEQCTGMCVSSALPRCHHAHRLLSVQNSLNRITHHRFSTQLIATPPRAPSSPITNCY
jgi:hypothetical protein